jgi:hypothetical protein
LVDFNSITAIAAPSFKIAPSAFFAPRSFLNSVVKLKFGIGLVVYPSTVPNSWFKKPS